MVQDNSSGHHLNAHADSDIWWQLVEITQGGYRNTNFRELIGCPLQSRGGSVVDGMTSSPFSLPLLWEPSHDVCEKASDSSSACSSAWLWWLSHVRRLSSFLGLLDSWRLTPPQQWLAPKAVCQKASLQFTPNQRCHGWVYSVEVVHRWLAFFFLLSSSFPVLVAALCGATLWGTFGDYVGIMKPPVVLHKTTLWFEARFPHVNSSRVLSGLMKDAVSVRYIDLHTCHFII